MNTITKRPYMLPSRQCRWKCHLLRAVRQVQARLDVLDVLDDSAVLITQDWAMNFLPQKYRESQSDWFGKRGIFLSLSEGGLVSWRASIACTSWKTALRTVQQSSKSWDISCKRCTKNNPRSRRNSSVKIMLVVITLPPPPTEFIIMFSNTAR